MVIISSLDSIHWEMVMGGVIDIVVVVQVFGMIIDFFYLQAKRQYRQAQSKPRF